MAKKTAAEWEQEIESAPSQGRWIVEEMAKKAKEEEKLADLQADIVAKEKEGPSEELMGEYRASLAGDVSRAPEIKKARGADMITAMRQAQGAQLARQYARGGPQVSPHLLRAQQNALAQETAAARATGGTMGARGAMLGGAGKGATTALRGVSDMTEEDLQNWIHAQQVLGQTRQGALKSADIATGAEGQEDAYGHARRLQAMDWLRMAQGQKAQYGQALLNLLNATQQGQAPASILPQAIQGIGTGVGQAFQTYNKLSSPQGPQSRPSNVGPQTSSQPRMMPEF